MIGTLQYNIKWTNFSCLLSHYHYILEYGVLSEIDVGHLDKKNNFILTDDILEEIEWKGMCISPIILTQGHGCRSGQSNHGGWTSFQLFRGVVHIKCKCVHKPLL